MGSGPADERRRARRAVAGLASVALALLAVGCSSWGRGRDLGPLSAEDFDDLYLKRAVGMVIHEALSESDPAALERFFPPGDRSQVDCQGFYREIMGARPGVYQPRFWEMKTLDIEYGQARQRARTNLTLECVDLTPGSGGAGRFIPLGLTWLKQAGDWYLEPPAAEVELTKPTD